MQMRRFGPTGRLVAAVGLGTWNLERSPHDEAVEAVRLAIELGMTHIDTAEMYGAGRVESLVGEAISGRRDRVFLVSKVLPDNASRRGVVAACEASLRRLKTDHLDCYLLHWPGSIPFSETLAGFEQLVRAGKTAYCGVSNFDTDELEQAIQLAGPNRIVCNQVLYHLRQRAIEHELLAYCEAHGCALVGYSPFGSGYFPAAGSRQGRALHAIATRRGVSARQVALAFLLRSPSAFVIPKSASRAHLEENAAAGELSLTDKDIAEIDAAFSRGPRPRELPML